MRTRRFRRNVESASYDLSISDLMAALCCIFVLVIVAIVCSLKDKNLAAERYVKTQQDIFTDLSKEFKEEIDEGKLDIDNETLSIRFPSVDKNGNSIQFNARSWELLNPLKKQLDNFFPKLVRILENKEYKDKIEEIRIEGFTAPDETSAGGEGSEADYTSGIDISQNRTREVLKYCLNNTNYSQETNPKKKEEEKKWLREHIVANGYSLTRPLGADKKRIKENRKLTQEEKAASRRIEFRIKTNSEDVIKQFQKINGN